MSRQWSSTVSQGSTRAFSFVVGQPSWVLRIALTIAAIVMVCVLLVLIVPALILGIAAFILLAIVARIRMWFGRLRSPNGAMDGRRNVRVIARQ